MSSNQRNKRTCTEDTNCEKKSRRRDTYGKIAADQKEAMLLQRRTKKIELEKCNDSIKSVVECPSERMKSQRDTMLSKQSPLTIRESSSANVKGSTSGTCKGQQDVSPEVISNTGSSHETPNLSTVFDKGKDVGHSFCGFERGKAATSAFNFVTSSCHRRTSKLKKLIHQDQHLVNLRDNKMPPLKLLPTKFSLNRSTIITHYLNF
ncbi:uncharacterized protein LOC107796790 isoform X2 [Nicotiana tabacum]|uniref:Uncharacterized protein LOC107796790 isoform X2 n=1 Tax=Nicotiana tabacum TaxID=4097 RepID=A0A1S4AF56_TOBAC|nr:PREDICTED: uncharacterized protein LOC107796790 isoform X3 [Nicotiana tabacum]